MSGVLRSGPSPPQLGRSVVRVPSRLFAVKHPIRLGGSPSRGLSEATYTMPSASNRSLDLFYREWMPRHANVRSSDWFRARFIPYDSTHSPPQLVRSDIRVPSRPFAVKNPIRLSGSPSRCSARPSPAGRTISSRNEPDTSARVPRPAAGSPGTQSCGHRSSPADRKTAPASSSDLGRAAPRPGFLPAPSCDSGA